MRSLAKVLKSRGRFEELVEIFDANVTKFEAQLTAMKVSFCRGKFECAGAHSVRGVGKIARSYRLTTTLVCHVAQDNLSKMMT